MNFITQQRNAVPVGGTGTGKTTYYLGLQNSPRCTSRRRVSRQTRTPPGVWGQGRGVLSENLIRPGVAWSG